MRAVVIAALLATVAGPAVAETARTSIDLKDGWSFRKGGTVAPDDTDRDAGEGAGGWTRVSVPHSWNRIGYYLPDPASHINRAETIDKYQGVGWYRLRFTPAAALKGRRTWLQFDAASRTAEVWLNGRRLGEHRGGFSRFRLDATDALRPGEANTLLVKVDNTKPEVGSTTADVLPLAGDFFVQGGLYRPVSLIATDPVHVDMMDAGGPGVYATTTRLAPERAAVDVRVRLRNDAAQARRLRARVTMLDAAGKIVASALRPLSLAAGKTGEVATTLAVADPHLWNGTADPYLHRLTVEVLAPGGAVLDRVEQPFGIRQMRADPDRGFFLNGRPLRLHGVGYHQDREGSGWATSAADVAEDMAILREMGANTIRLTHYQHGQPIHDLADRYGLILWDEIPLVSQWTLGDARVATPALRENMRQQMRELIRQNANHPSVFSWGIANEVDFGKSVPAFITSASGDAPDPMPLLGELHALARAEDPSRPTAIATCCEAMGLPAAASVRVVAGAADLGGANRYFGWYTGSADDLGPHLDRLRTARPNQPLSVTEYGAGGATTVHTDNPLGGMPEVRGRAQPEGYESYIHERAWAALETRPYLWATWLWNAFDFATTVRQEGDASDINTKGLVTFDRKIRKDAYYFYKANWTATPTVHVTGRRYVDRAYPVTDVRAYSNAPRTELVVNGRAIGTLAACPQRICVWPDVRLAAGDNRVVARGVFASGTVEDGVGWRLAPEQAAAIRIDSGAIVAGAGAGRRFGSDDFFDGGVAVDVNSFPGWGKPPPRKVVSGTVDGAVAATYREGSFAYRVPMADGRYTVTLTFVEPSLAPGARRFDVLADGRPVVSDLDVAKEAGAPLAALVRRVPVTVKGGALELRFVPRTGKAIVSAIEVAR